MSRRGRTRINLLFWIIAIASPFILLRLLYEEIGKIGMLILTALVILIIVFILIIKNKNNEHGISEDKYSTLDLSKIKGEEGENIISSLLEKIKTNYGGKVINDVIVVIENESSQIDHIFIHNSGVYVIETKNYSGKIFGKENEKTWTQVLSYGNEKHPMYNPVLQNKGHINRLDKLVNLKTKYYSIVVFIQENIEYIFSKSVYTPETMEAFILEHINENNITDTEVDIIYDIIMEHKTNPKITIDEHVEHIKNPHSILNINEQKNAECPLCGGRIIEKLDINNKPFFGCINYPDCKYKSKTKDNRHENS